MTRIVRAAAAVLIILALVSAIFRVAFFLSKILDFPAFLDLPIVLRVMGGISMGVGGVLVIWLLKFRQPAKMAESTYYTFRKMVTGAPAGELSGRVEPLIISGPQKYVRHPLYLGAILGFSGWSLLTGTTSDFIATLFIILWFLLVQIPFEEKEMRALFGEQYVRYMHDTPMLGPFTKRGSR